MSTGATEVDDQRVAALLKWIVHQTDRNKQRMVRAGRQQLGQCGRTCQRWQPDLMGFRAEPGQPVQGHVHQGRAGRRLRRHRRDSDGEQSGHRIVVIARWGRPGYERGLKSQQLSVRGPQQAGARCAGQLMRVGDPDDRTGLGRREGLEADPVREVGVQSTQAAFVQSLAGQQQMNAQ